MGYHIGGAASSLIETFPPHSSWRTGLSACLSHFIWLWCEYGLDLHPPRRPQGGGEQLRPQCCHCGRYSLYGFRWRCRRRPFLGLNHCWPLTDTAAFSAAYYYAAQANAVLPALPPKAALSFPPSEARPCTLERPSRLSRSRSSCNWKRCASAVLVCIQASS